MRDYWAYYVGSAAGAAAGYLRNEYLARYGGRERGVMSRNAVFGIMFLLTCACLILSGYFNGKAASQLQDATDLSEANEARAKLLDQKFDCIQKINTAQLDALKARSGFAEQTRAIQVAFTREFGDSLDVLLDPKASEEERSIAIVGLRHKLDVQEHSLVEQTETAIENPYPTDEEIRRCRTLE